MTKSTTIERRGRVKSLTNDHGSNKKNEDEKEVLAYLWVFSELSCAI